MPRRTSRRLRGAVSWTLTALALTLAAAVLVPALLGLERYVLTGGSMAGTYGKGSLVYARAVPVADLRVGEPFLARLWENLIHLRPRPKDATKGEEQR